MLSAEQILVEQRKTKFHDVEAISYENEKLFNVSELRLFENLKYLNLCSNLLQRVNEVPCLMELKYVNISYNQLSSFIAIPGMLCLEELNLNNNAIFYLNVNACNELRVLNISNNELADLNGCQFCRNLLSLDCSYNRIECFDSAFTKLEKICLGSNPASSRLEKLESLNPQLVIVSIIPEDPVHVYEHLPKEIELNASREIQYTDSSNINQRIASLELENMQITELLLGLQKQQALPELQPQAEQYGSLPQQQVQNGYQSQPPAGSEVQEFFSDFSELLAQESLRDDVLRCIGSRLSKQSGGKVYPYYFELQYYLQSTQLRENQYSRRENNTVVRQSVRDLKESPQQSPKSDKVVTVKYQTVEAFPASEKLELPDEISTEKLDQHEYSAESSQNQDRQAAIEQKMSILAPSGQASAESAQPTQAVLSSPRGTSSHAKTAPQEEEFNVKSATFMNSPPNKNSTSTLVKQNSKFFASQDQLLLENENTLRYSVSNRSDSASEPTITQDDNAIELPKQGTLIKPPSAEPQISGIETSSRPVSEFSNVIQENPTLEKENVFAKVEKEKSDSIPTRISLTDSQSAENAIPQLKNVRGVESDDEFDDVDLEPNW